MVEQQLIRLGEDEAAQVIRRALEIQGEPNTVTIDELRQAATELRIDPSALERALAERLAEQPSRAPTAGEVVSLYRTELKRGWQGGAPKSHIEALLTALGVSRNMWVTPMGQRSVWTAKCALGLGSGEISVVQVDGVTTLSAQVHVWPSLLVGLACWPLFFAFFWMAFPGPYGDRASADSQFVAVSLFLAALTTGLVNGFAIRVARNKLDRIEAALKGAPRR